MTSDVADDDVSNRRGVLDIAIEFSWLAALALVPLVFSGRDVVVFFQQPKDFILHFIALLIVALWGADWALRTDRPLKDFRSWAAIQHWPDHTPRNWALFAAGGFGLSAVISTLLSPLPMVSLWGRDFSELGYELYSVLSLLVIFFAIALRVKSEDQVKRILWVVVVTGALTGLYGVSQRFGWDPIGNGAGQARVISSFGNPILFGSYLVMSSVITLGLALDTSRKDSRWWLPGLAALLGVQLAAMWFTGSRGPWIGVAIGLGGFALLGVMSFDRARLLRAASVLAAAVLLAVVITNLAGPASRGPSRGLSSVVSGATEDVVGLGGRTDIWLASVRLLDSWERPSEESDIASAMRPLFGLGPEMYYYSHPLVTDPKDGLIVAGHAHNWPLQIVLELGLAGLLTFAVLTLSVLIAGFSVIRSRRSGPRNEGDWLLVAMVAVIASLAGRSVEQMAGIARIGDLLLFWALLAVVLAVYGISNGAVSGVRSKLRVKFAVVPIVTISTLLVLTAGVFIVRDVQMLRAGVVAGDAFAAGRAGDRAESITLLQRAIDLAPDVEQYRVQTGELLFEEAQAQPTAEAALPFLVAALQTFTSYEDRDPLSFITRLRISAVEAEMVKRGELALQNDLIFRLIRIADSMPSYPSVQAIVAEREFLARQMELALFFADRAIAMEAQTSPQPLAWLKRGQALGELGDVDGALESLSTGLEREPTGKHAPSLHRSLALVYDSLGDSELAAEHRAQAVELGTPSASEGP